MKMDSLLPVTGTLLLLALISCNGSPERQTIPDHLMIGHIAMREANVVGCLAGSNPVEATVWAEGEEDKVRSFKGETSENFNTVHYTFALLEPGTGYTAVIGSDTLTFVTQPLWDYRTDPPEFTLVTGSCTYVNEPDYDRPGEPYGGNYEIFETIESMSPDVMLWLGDNIYLREVDMQSKAGFRHRYEHMRALPEIQGLLQSCPNYAIWDDHDFGPNDADGSWVHRDWALEAFKAFWANPSYGIAGKVEGTSSQFRFGDIEFFLLDNRYNRVNHHNKTSETGVLGQDQLDWLMQALSNSRAPFKLVAIGGQVVSDAAIYENMAQFPSERTQLLDRIAEEGIKGVVFLTGDRHNGELSLWESEEGWQVYDLTASPLTSRAYDHTNEPNSLRVPGTMVGERNFASLRFSGKRKERVLDITMHNTQGDTLWSHQVEAGAWWR
jgi:alkaline phosphatase D